MPQARPTLAATAILSLVAAAARPATDVRLSTNVDSDPHTTQSTTCVARSGNTLVAGWNDTGHESSPSLVGWGVSTDGGATWVDEGPLLPTGPVTRNTGYPRLRAHLASGNFHFATKARNPFSTIAVYTDATPASAPFWAAVGAVTPGGELIDDFSMDVDNSPTATNGKVYVCWTSNVGVGSEIYLSRNHDAGAGAAIVNDGQSLVTSGWVGGCQVAVDQATGGVWVAWFYTNGTVYEFRARRSVDGGLTFGPSRSIGPAGAGSLPCSSCTRSTLNGDVRVPIERFSVAVNPATHNFHLVSEVAGFVPDTADIQYIRCPPAGSASIGSCTAPFRLNSDGTTRNQWHPVIAAAPAPLGTLMAMWYDRRDDPGNLRFEVYKRHSGDDGNCWTPDERVTDATSGVPVLCPANFDDFNCPCCMGEYDALAADAAGFYYTWSDNRDTASYGRPDPDVYFDRELVGGCIAAGQCLDTTLASCNEQHGIWKGAGIPCQSPCAPVGSGACCLTGGDQCLQTDAAGCQAAHGCFKGPGTMCGQTCCLCGGGCQIDLRAGTKKLPSLIDHQDPGSE